MMLSIIDDAGDAMDSVNCTLSTSGDVVSVGSVGYPTELFLEVYRVASAIDKPYGFWSMGFDPILKEEIERKVVNFDRYSDNVYENDGDILRFNRSMIHAVK